MNKFKIFFAAILTVLAALSLCACGEVPEEAGKYTGAGYELSGADYAEPELAYAVLELGSGGKGIFTAGDESGRISWKAEGDKLRLNIDGSRFYAWEADGVLRLEINQDVKVIFLKEGAEMPESSGAELPRDYYGWWRITDAQGEMPETWIDCCARLESQQGLMYFSIWDEDGSMENPMGRALMGLSDGVPVSRQGQFWYSELSEGQWQLSAEKEQETGEELIKLSGQALDRSGGSFSYEIFLKPWGEKWDDANKESLPYYYNTWYLPLIQEGAEMPLSFEGAESPLNVEKPDRDEAETPAEPANKVPAPQTPKPGANGQSVQENKDFNEDEMSGFTDDFGG